MQSRGVRHKGTVKDKLYSAVFSCLVCEGFTTAWYAYCVSAYENVFHKQACCKDGTRHAEVCRSQARPDTLG